MDVKTGSLTTGQNLTALDSQVKSNADAIGTNITNISKNAGDIAVNQQDISSLKDLSNITTAGTTVIKNAAKEAIDVQGTDLATVTSTVDDQSGKKTYTVSVKADGKVADGDTKLVSGDTVYDALQTEKGATETALNGKANVDASNLTTGNVTSWQNVLGNGIVANGNSGLVTGGTVYNEVRPAANGTYVKTGSTTSQNLTALDSQVKSNADAIGTNITNISKNAGDIAVNQQDISSLKDLSNITTAGTTVIKNAAKEAIDVQGTDLATVTSTVDDQSGKKTYTVSVKADGKVADGDTKLVSGDTVYDALQTEKGATETALNGKANVDASNLTTGNVTSWQNVLGNGIVANGNSGLVTGGTVYNEVRPAADGTYVKTGSTTGQNLTALDSQVKSNADAIHSLEDGAVQYDKGSNKGKVTLGGADGTTIANIKDGVIGAGSKEAVNGGQLYSEQQAREAADAAINQKIGVLNQDGNYIRKDASVSDNLSTLDDNVKANADAISNINSSVSELSENAVQYDKGSNKGKVTLGGADGTTIANVKDGIIGAGSKDAVNGGQLYSEQQAREAADAAINQKIGVLNQDGNYIRKTHRFQIT